MLFLSTTNSSQYSKVDQHSNIVFKTFKNLEFLQNTENYLLVFDDSCEEIFSEKEFFKLATAGQNKNININYVKCNFYQQNKWLRTIDLNKIYIKLFKPPRGVQQVDFLGKQLNPNNFLKNCYELATRETFGDLFISSQKLLIFYNFVPTLQFLDHRCSICLQTQPI